jgi:hypothetical protein
VSGFPEGVPCRHDSVPDTLNQDQSFYRRQLLGLYDTPELTQTLIIAISEIGLSKLACILRGF